MKKYIYSLLTVGVGSMALVNTSCIEEVVPTTVATTEQVGASAKSTEGLLFAMPQYLNAGNDDYHFQFGYGCMIHVRDVMTGDMPITFHDYDWFSPWTENNGLSKNLARSSYIYNYYYKLVQTANNLVSVVDPSSAAEETLGNLGAALAYRAMAYLDIARMYEFLPNDKINGVNADGNNVTGLTAPIVRETTTETQSRNNPRATHQQMYDFILADLNNAEKYIVGFKQDSKTFPHLDAVYGLKARLYMWNEDYANAEKYARLAIDEAKKLKTVPMTEKECLDTKTGFNDISKWMWGAQQTSEDYTVKTGIINWTSWMSNETTFGYASAGPYVMIDKSLYDKISNTDFRKRMFKAPKGTPLYGKSEYLDAEAAEEYPDYASLKFRPNEGEMKDYKTGAASAFPLMRVEEMFLIEAEAAAQQDPARGIALINSFMKTYRDASYNCKAAAKDDVIQEIVLQKRVELFGEGHTFFDIKRLNMPVTRSYKGTNYDDTKALFNTTTRPAWMNLVISQSEEDNNNGVVGFNNPDPSGCYDAVPQE